jgi:hypothetical protein
MEAITQEKLLSLLIPLLEEKGKRYQKNAKVLARPARVGEKIETITSDGLETSNTAQAGDVIITNLTEASEQYIMPAEKFEKRYHLLEQKGAQSAVYQAIGKIIAIKLTPTLLQSLELTREFHFQAPWGESMIAKQGDYLALPIPALNEVYRIAQKEFKETYKPIN